MNYKLLAAILALASTPVIHAIAAPVYVPFNANPPEVRREFRGAWIATVENIDWPSKPGLPAAQQQAELLALLDRAVKLNLNAIVLQVRPACDAIYASKIEPWSYYLSGTMGKPPEPYYDPLEFAVTEAHKRGLELHAWFNPFRAGFRNSKGAFSANHISKTHPEMVVTYGKYLWLDPGEKEVQDYSLRVIMDVVRRYDIDGVHFDDYFYSYKQQDAQKRDLDFPDWASWKKYYPHGKLSRDDWRRQNVNTFVQRVYESIKAVKPWVKFGIAPFGIWQPKVPPQIKGFNAYDVLYCDSRKWLANGWLDYCSPQLYWAIDPPEQSFPVLFKWWRENNPQNRNIWPGLASENVGAKWKPDEIINQIKITREHGGPAPGVVQWSFKCLMEDKGGLATALEKGVYAQPALVPPSPWLEHLTPGKPKIKVQSAEGESGGKLSWSSGGWETMSSWVIQTKMTPADQWQTQILTGDVREISLQHLPWAIAVTAIDRCDVASPAAVVRLEPGRAN